MRSFFKYILLFCLLNIASCSSYSVKTVLDDSGDLEDAKKVGVIVRTSSRGRVHGKDILKDISSTINGYQKSSEVIFLPGLPNSLTKFESSSERFFQKSGEESKSLMYISYSTNEFLKYKSLGVINNYIRENRDALKAKMSENKCEGLVIYEVVCIISVEMQMMRFESAMIGLDKKLNLVYFDHQTDDFESNEFDFERIKNQLLSKISSRFVDQMLDMDFIEEI